MWLRNLWAHRGLWWDKGKELLLNLTGGGLRGGDSKALSVPMTRGILSLSLGSRFLRLCALLWKSSSSGFIPSV